MKDNLSAVVFPGQGAQRPGMALDFFEKFDVVRQTFNEAGEAVGEDIAAICFSENDNRLNLTEFTQPCILTVEMAIYRVLQKEFNFAPDYFGGHSLGEYTALTAAEIFSFPDAVRIVRKQGALMQSAVPQKEGAMAAIIFPEIEKSAYREIVEKNGAEVANLNSPSQVVISGWKNAVKAAAEELETELGNKNGENGKESIDIRFLDVSAPVHSSLMHPVEKEYGRYLQKFAGNFKLKKISRVVSNYSGEFHKAETLIENLVGQLSGSVRWIENMHLIASHTRKIFEVGPNRPLGSFFKSIGYEVKSVTNIRSMTKVFQN